MRVLAKSRMSDSSMFVPSHWKYIFQDNLFCPNQENSWAVVMCCVVCDLKWHPANRLPRDPVWVTMQKASFLVSSVYNPEWVSGINCWYISKNIACVLIIYRCMFKRTLPAYFEQSNISLHPLMRNTNILQLLIKCLF